MNLFSSTLLHSWCHLSPPCLGKRSLQWVLEGLTVEYGHPSTVPGIVTDPLSFVLQVSTSLHSAATPTPPSSWALRWACWRWSCPQSRNVTRPNHEAISAGSPGGWSRGEAALVAVWPPQLLLFIFSWAIQHSETQTPSPVLPCCSSPSRCQNSVACRFGCCLQLRQQSIPIISISSSYISSLRLKHRHHVPGKQNLPPSTTQAQEWQGLLNASVQL